MELIKYPMALVLSLLMLTIINIAGCSSTGIERSKSATTTMETVDSDIKLVVVQLDATGASLDELMKPGQSDVKKAFDLFSANTLKMEKMEKDFSKHADEMKANGKDYFSEWQKEGAKYKNPRIQELSEQRRSALGDTYGKISESSRGMKEAFKTYISDIKEIQIYLSNDLTTGGIEAITGISRKVVNDGDNLKYTIRNVQSAIESARLEMAQTGVSNN